MAWGALHGTAPERFARRVVFVKSGGCSSLQLFSLRMR